MNESSFVNFESVEKKYMSILRKKITTSESKADLARNFSCTVSSFLNNVLDNKTSVYEDDISFRPDIGNKYLLSPKLKQSEYFLETWNNSNLPHFISKAADTAYHRYIHLNKHTEKTEKKIRQNSSKR